MSMDETVREHHRRGGAVACERGNWRCVEMSSAPRRATAGTLVFDEKHRLFGVPLANAKNYRPVGQITSSAGNPDLAVDMARKRSAANMRRQLARLDMSAPAQRRSVDVLGLAASADVTPRNSMLAELRKAGLTPVEGK